MNLALTHFISSLTEYQILFSQWIMNENHYLLFCKYYAFYNNGIVKCLLSNTVTQLSKYWIFKRIILISILFALFKI